MSDRSMVFVRTQEEFQQAIERDPQTTLVILNAHRTFVLPAAQRDIPFPDVVAMGGAAIIGGHCPLHIILLGHSDAAVADVTSVWTATSGSVSVADTPKVTIFSAGTSVVRNCETVIANKGISVAAYDCGQVIIEGSTNESDA